MSTAEIEARQDELYRMVAWFEEHGELFYMQYSHDRGAELDKLRGGDMSSENYAEIRRGKMRYYYVVRSKANGQVLSTSEKYYSRWNARRAAKKAGYIVHG